MLFANAGVVPRPRTVSVLVSVWLPGCTSADEEIPSTRPAACPRRHTQSDPAQPKNCRGTSCGTRLLQAGLRAGQPAGLFVRDAQLAIEPPQRVALGIELTQVPGSKAC